MGFTVPQNVPPLQCQYKDLLEESENQAKLEEVEQEGIDLPLIDLEQGINDDEMERNSMRRAAREWGFFQLINHGIPPTTIHQIQLQQKKLFNLPFEVKMNMDCYKWGTPTAVTAKHLSWMEAFHIPFSQSKAPQFTPTFRMAMEEYWQAMGKLAQKVVGILADDIQFRGGNNASYFRTNCTQETSYLRFNKYPQCPIPSHVLGLVSHSDSDFLTILNQDNVGGLQIMKGCKWVSVNPNPNALIVNIGDLLQVWSNDVYKSVQHRAVVNKNKERMSIAYFMCPSEDAVITRHQSDSHLDSDPPHYSLFTFGDFRAQVNEDVRLTGTKIGLPRFRLKKKLGD